VILKIRGKTVVDKGGEEVLNGVGFEMKEM